VPESQLRQRLDKWLFFARVMKSRSLATKMVEAGRIRVNREKTDHAARQVKPGDVLTITLDRQVLVYEVVECGTRRGPAEEARTLYKDLTPPAAAKAAAPPRAMPPTREPGAGRPTKKERREIDSFRSGE
jgi:ribosome-associated heat shock protein Hsp15